MSLHYFVKCQCPVFSVIAFKTLTFHTECSDTWGVMGFLVTALLQMFSWFWQWNEFEFDKVKAYKKFAILDHPLLLLYYIITILHLILGVICSSWNYPLNERGGVCMKRSVRTDLCADDERTCPVVGTSWMVVSSSFPSLTSSYPCRPHTVLAYSPFFESFDSFELYDLYGIVSSTRR